MQKGKQADVELHERTPLLSGPEVGQTDLASEKTVRDTIELGLRSLLVANQVLDECQRRKRATRSGRFDDKLLASLHTSFVKSIDQSERSCLEAQRLLNGMSNLTQSSERALRRRSLSDQLSLADRVREDRDAITELQIEIDEMRQSIGEIRERAHSEQSFPGLIRAASDLSTPLPTATSKPTPRHYGSTGDVLVDVDTADTMLSQQTASQLREDQIAAREEQCTDSLEFALRIEKETAMIACPFVILLSLALTDPLPLYRCFLPSLLQLCSLIFDSWLISNRTRSVCCQLCSFVCDSSSLRSLRFDPE